MERKPKRYFSPEFKREILDKLAQGLGTKAELAQQHDLTVALICRWKREARDGELDQAVEGAPRVEGMGVDPKYVRHLEEKLREANEKLGELYVVVEGIKKVQESRFLRNANSFVVSSRGLARSRGPAK